MNDLERILDAVGSEYGQPRHALLALSRGRKDVAEARQVAMYLAAKLCPSMPLTTIGLFFGRDRTTVRHSKAKIALSGGEKVKKLEARLVRTITAI